MTGYTRTWNCRVCGDRCESVDYPQVYVCERCIRPLANRFCWEMFKTNLGPGIDALYFERKAYAYAESLFGKGQHTTGRRPLPSQDYEVTVP